MTMLKAATQLVIRRATADDAPACGQICHDAFESINRAHGFPPDFGDVKHAVGLLSGLFSHPGFYCLVAEVDGRIAGSNCLDERASIAGVGPITIDPNLQNHGIGRGLMTAVLERAREQGKPGVRLVQAAFHNRSLSLYARLGFEIREPLSCMQGRPLEREVPGYRVRPAEAADLEYCNALSYRIHGFDRGRDLAEAQENGTARVVERNGRITGYASALAFMGHATAESNEDLKALIASAEGFGGPGILVPSRNGELFRWCLGNGLRVVEPLTLMSMGLYSAPAGAWLAAILF